MGLFDAMNDPETMGLLAAAANMLQASGPSTKPTGLGQVLGGGLMGGMQAFQGTKRQNADLEKEQLQMDMLKQQVAQATRQNSLINNMLEQFSGGNNSNVGQSMLNGKGPTIENANRLPATQSQSGALNGIPRQALAFDLAFNGGKGLGDMAYKRSVPDMQVSNGYAYDKNRLPQGFLPQMNISQNGQASMISVDENGNPTVSAPRGALDTFNAYRGADERAKASMQLLPLGYEAVGQDGKTIPVGGSVGAYLTSQTSAPQVAQSQPFSAPTSTNIKPPLPPSMLGIPTGSINTGARLASEAEKESALGKVKAENDALTAKLKAESIPTSARQSAIASGNQILATIQKAIDHPGRETSTGTSSILDPRNFVPGTNAKDFKAILDQIKGSAFLQAFDSLKGGGAITEIEGQKATNAIARLDTSQTDKEFKNALTELQDVVSNALTRTKESAKNAGMPTDFAGDNSNMNAPKLPDNLKTSNLKINQTYTLPNGEIGVWDGFQFKVNK